VIPISQLEMLHRHGDEWKPLEEVGHHSASDHDLERRLLRGDKLFRCADCDLEILVVPPDQT
jgi:hypothetical protein